jgi:hypothetical protein
MEAGGGHPSSCGSLTNFSRLLFMHYLFLDAALESGGAGSSGLWLRLAGALKVLRRCCLVSRSLISRATEVYSSTSFMLEKFPSLIGDLFMLLSPVMERYMFQLEVITLNISY